MSHFTHIIGGLLEELTQARAESDNFSAQLSQQYYEDPYLQHFPVPRMEMGVVHFKMKMAVLDEKIKTQTLLNYYDKAAQTLSDSWLNTFGTHLKLIEDNNALVDDLNALVTDQKFQEEVLINLRFIFRNISSSMLNSAFELDIDQAYEKLHPSLSTWYLSQPLLVELYVEDQAALTRLTLAMEVTSQQQLLTMQNNILEIASDSANLESEIDINADRLRNMPESSITEVDFSARVQNYQWTTEDDGDGEPSTHLLPL